MISTNSSLKTQFFHNDYLSRAFFITSDIDNILSNLQKTEQIKQNKLQKSFFYPALFCLTLMLIKSQKIKALYHMRR